jgi:hypothetical protein
MYDCFRPGDVVRAKVLSLGDARSYYLTTADNALGVVHAKSLAGGRTPPGTGACCILAHLAVQPHDALKRPCECACLCVCV